MQECYIATLEILGIVNRMLAPDLRISLRRHARKHALIGEIRTDGDWTVQTKLALTNDEWNEACGLISTAGFWKLPHRDIHAVPCMDGDAWKIEGFANDRYHFVYRATDSDPEIYDLGRALARLANLDE